MDGPVGGWTPVLLPKIMVVAAPPANIQFPVWKLLLPGCYLISFSTASSVLAGAGCWEENPPAWSG